MRVCGVLILTTAIWCHLGSCQLSEECNQVSTDTVDIAMLIEVSEKCDGDRVIRPKALAFALIAELGVEVLNRDNSTGLKVPGINYRLNIYDICYNGSFGVKTAASLLPTAVWKEKEFCSSSDNSTSPLLLGFLGPETSAVAKPLASFVNELNIPIVSPSSKLAVLSNKDLYGSFYRTSPTNLVESRALIDMLVHLNFRYVMVVHIDDEYGRESAEVVKEYAARKGVCVSQVRYISMQTMHEEATENFRSTGDVTTLVRQMNDDSAKAIIYLGYSEVNDLIAVYLREANYDFRGKKLILSSYTLKQNEMQLISEGPFRFHIFLEVLYMYPYSSSHLITKVENSIATILSNDSRSLKVSEWLRDLDDSQQVLQYAMYSRSVLEALYAIVNGFQAIHQETCHDELGVCPMLSTVGTDLFYANMNRAIQIGKLNASFSDEKLHLNFGNSSDKKFMSEEIMYCFTRIGNEHLKAVAHYVKDDHIAVIRPAENYGSINITSISSICNPTQKDCNCGARYPDYVFKKGNSPLLLIGVGYISETQSDFSCGELRISNFIRMQAFYYGVEVIKNRTSIDFSTLYIDSCSAKLRVNRIFTNLFNNTEHISVIDYYGDTHHIPIKYIMAVIGDQSSGDTIYMQNIIQRFNIAMVSDGATSIWLSDRMRYPHFLRTVPADDAQSSIMLDLANDLGVKHIGLIYTSTVYAQTAIEALKKRAVEINMCISYDKTIVKKTNGTAGNIDEIANEITTTETQVFVYFGEYEEIRPLLTALNVNPSRKQKWRQGGKLFIGSELWADNELLIQGNEEVAVGSLTFALSNDRFPGGEDNFIKYLTSKTPETEKNDQIFLSVWQKLFSCHLPGQHSEFLQGCSNQCSLGIRGSCSSNRLPYSETFAVHSLMAVLSVGFALHNLNCFDCLHQFKDDSSRESFFKQLEQVRIPNSKDINVPEYTPFLTDGNGLKHYTIFNIQKDVGNAGAAIYVPVYKVVDGELKSEKQVLQYNANGVVSNFQFEECVSCTCLKMAKDEITSTTKPPSDNNYRLMVAGLVVLILLLVITIVFIFIALQKKCSRSSGSTAVPVPVGNGSRNTVLSVKYETSSHLDDEYDVPQVNTSVVRNTEVPIEYHLANDRGNDSSLSTFNHNEGRISLSHNKPSTSQTTPSSKTRRNVYVKQPSEEYFIGRPGEVPAFNQAVALSKPQPLTLTSTNQQNFDSNDVHSSEPIPSSDDSLDDYFDNKAYDGDK